MKKIILLVAVIVLVFTAGAGFAATNLDVQTGFNFDWWGDNRGSHASQFYTPILLDGKYEDVSVRFLTAYAETHASLPGYGSISMGHFLDSKLGATYQLLNKLPVDIMLGLDLNLPTGKTNLSKAETRLIMDSNLISINNFGEGFNVNPTITVAKSWRDWSAAFGFGYLWRGSYDFSSELLLTDYQPGEVYTTSAEVRYNLSPATYYRLFGGYSWFGKDTSHGKDIYQEGDIGIVGFGMYYNRAKEWDTSLTLSGVIRGKVQYNDVNVGVLTIESGNTNRDEFIMDFLGRYLLDEKTTILMPLQYKYLAGNGYSVNNLNALGLGPANKVLYGIGVTRALGNGLYAELNLKGFYLHGDIYQVDLLTTTNSYNGFSGIISLVGKF